MTAEGTSQGFVSPDGASIVVTSGAGTQLVVPSAGGEPRTVPGMTSDDYVLRFGADSRSLIVYHGTQLPVKSERLDIATGRREPLHTFGSIETAGALRLGTFALLDDGKSYAYSYGYQLLAPVRRRRGRADRRRKFPSLR